MQTTLVWGQNLDFEVKQDPFALNFQKMTSNNSCLAAISGNRPQTSFDLEAISRKHIPNNPLFAAMQSRDPFRDASRG
jgi:hypothetical protein